VPRRIVYSLVFLTAAAGLVWACWPGSPANPATLINRVDVVAVVAMLAGLPWLARRAFGPAGGSWLARIVRVGSYAVVFALVLVKAEVERSEYAVHSGRAWLAGVWAGEIIFLLVIAAYVAGILAVTARRPPFSPVALAVGAGAGAAAGLLMYALPPVGRWPPITLGWLASVYDVARVLALPLALGTGIAAGLVAARRAGRRRQRLPLADVRARQGMATGLCAGAAAALVFCVLSTGTVALLPHMVKPLLWVFTNPRPVALTFGGAPLPGPLRHPDTHNAALYQFEMSVADTAAGYLLALICFPLVGAGLGAWGGLFAAGHPGRRPGGGGGGGGGQPEPGPPPPDGGRRAAEDRRPAMLRGYLHELPGFPAPGDEPAAAPASPEKVPAGYRADDRCSARAVGGQGVRLRLSRPLRIRSSPNSNSVWSSHQPRVEAGSSWAISASIAARWGNWLAMSAGGAAVASPEPDPSPGSNGSWENPSARLPSACSAWWARS